MGGTEEFWSVRGAGGAIGRPLYQINECGENRWRTYQMVQSYDGCATRMQTITILIQLDTESSDAPRIERYTD